MPRKKKIEEEIKESEIKTNEIKTETDILEDKETIQEAENINEMTIIVYNKEYKVSELIKLMNKKNKTYNEKEIVKQFKELMLNYYRGIEYATFRNCCGKHYTVEDLKSKVDYEAVERRCSRKSIKFDKVTVDTIIKFIEDYC